MTKATGSTNLVRSLAWLVTSGFAVCGAGFLALALVGTVDMLLIQSQAGDLTHGLELTGGTARGAPGFSIASATMSTLGLRG